MTARYGDRFRQLPTTPQPDVVDLGEIGRGPGHSLGDQLDDDELGAVPGRRWHQSWAARLALVAALLAGAAGGAVGWERWNAHEAAVAARSAVEVVAAMVTLSYTADDEIAVALTYRNDGEHEIILRDVRFDSDRLVPLSDPEVLTIVPGDSETHIFDVRAGCAGGDDVAVEAPDLIATVETVDGVVRERVITSDLVAAEVTEWFGYACQAQYYVPIFSETYADITTVTTSDDGLTVRAMINFGFDRTTQVEINSVVASSAAFAVEYTVGDMESSTSFQARPVHVAYRVADCSLALAATEQDMSVAITGQVDDTEPGELTAFPTSELAIELTRLAHRACPA